MQLNQDKKRFGISLLLSVVFHVLLVQLVVWSVPDKPLTSKQPPKVMDVVLLDPNKVTKPKQADKDARTISNQTAQGSSKNAKDDSTRLAKSPLPGKQQNKPQPAPKKPTPPKAVVQQKNQRARTLTKKGLALDGNLDSIPVPKKEITKKGVPAKEIPLANLMPSSMALSQLSRDFEREKRLKQMLSHEADIPINTREAKYAPYARALVSALEEQWRPGQADYQKYSDNERRSMMRITIENNGELGGVEILRPSPVAIINESAVEAIHAAAPFRPLPSSWGLDRVSFYLTFEVVNDRFVFKTL